MGVRILTVVAVLVSAVVHLYLWLDGVREQGTVGRLFVVNVVAGLAIAVALLVWRSWVPPFLSVGFGATTLLAFVISATVGLFGIVASWDTWYAWLAALSEVVAVVGGLVLLMPWLSRWTSGRRQHHTPVGGAHLH
jgi:hypothetical protein